MQKITCRLCEHETSKIIDFGSMPIANNFVKSMENDTYRFNMTATFCAFCYMFQLNEQPEPAKMFHSGYPFFTSSSENMKKHFELMAKNHLPISKNKEEIFVRIHHDKFKRVISNLISNAVKFSDNGTKIIITTQYLNKRVLIKFKDHGIGIPPKLQEIIFDKYTKAGRFGTAGEKSFGLGLSIVKQIVKLHDGSVWLESEENKGTTVFIELNTTI
jgi:signal transduction histidine kinase